jgi:hypothetical protein
MPWQTKVPLWVLQVVGEFIIPDDSEFTTSSTLQKLDDAVNPVSSSASTFTFDFPGLIPNVSLKSEYVPTTNGFNITLRVAKAVGFYGVLTTILSFDPKRLNDWTFPLERRNFGYLALSRQDKVSLNQPIHYSRQYHIDDSVVGLASNYDIERTETTLTNAIDKYALDRISGFQYPSVTTRIAFLPIQEEWAVRFFQKNS